jgi:hypothetical protein
MKNKQFRINSKSIFLTYSQSQLTKDIIMEFMKSFDNLKYILIGEELHKNLGLHFHVLAKFQNKKNIKTVNYFDINGEHPNIQSTKNINKCIEYCIKNNNFIEYGQNTATTKEFKQNLFKYAEIIEDDKEYMNRCYKSKVNLGWAKAARNVCKTGHITYEKPIIQNINNYINFNLNIELNNETTPKTIILLGKPGCGKTSWAIQNSQYPMLMANNEESLRAMTKEVKTIIFDDFDFGKANREEILALVENHQKRDIRILYGSVIIDKGVFKDKAIGRRCQLICIGNHQELNHLKDKYGSIFKKTTYIKEFNINDTHV